MNIKIKDLMVRSVITTMPHKTVGHAQSIMNKNKIKSVPVVDSDRQIKGIITATDLLDDHSEATPVSKVMTTQVYTIPAYSNVNIAARMMRNHNINHLVVSDEQKIIGVLSAHDLLKLVEDHRFVMKNPSTPSKSKNSRE
ncbi:MAG: CBS domain-containing protein [Bacteroidia bacterium]|nr:CBS domain-containing protein [Bacteroidia bacterium]NND26698.1 CBS domain-containing protein [Flavobacteriaceae bacterium]RZW39976.1 MAG: CBS domain-containing protein [Flavobacteriaceae bacterium]